MSGRPDPARQLLRALTRSAEAAGCVVAFDHIGQTPWASATLVGGQHRVTARGDGGAAFESWLADLAEAELALHGHYVASCAVAREGDAVLTVLVLEE